MTRTCLILAFTSLTLAATSASAMEKRVSTVGKDQSTILAEVASLTRAACRGTTGLVPIHPADGDCMKVAMRAAQAQLEKAAPAANSQLAYAK